MDDEQVKYYRSKLEFEIDPSDLFAALNAGEKVVVIDARQAHGYEREHIPSALNLPHREMSETTTGHLDRGALYVTYCDGIGCNASTKGALKMAQLGFNVKELIGGLEWWKFDGYGTDGTAASSGLAIECAC
ncbi:MAG TPA: rhodanese-like domain-containing protein [Pyrinomonadaceae bacterium]|nr:rhodanese-like domain-containing protein [Pyrinomonadaceae bacterium]